MFLSTCDPLTSHDHLCFKQPLLYSHQYVPFSVTSVHFSITSTRGYATNHLPHDTPLRSCNSNDMLMRMRRGLVTKSISRKERMKAVEERKQGASLKLLSGKGNEGPQGRLDKQESTRMRQWVKGPSFSVPGGGGGMRQQK